MMISRLVWLLVANVISAQDTSSVTSASSGAAGLTLSISGTIAITSGGDVPVGSQATYLSPSETITFSTTGTASTATGSPNNSTLTTSVTSIAGTRTGNGTTTRTSTSAQPSNTQPCNGFPQFCDRSYSNISMIAAHNFPFTGRSIAANQKYGVVEQLNDGVRMLQGQIHLVNNTLYYCHTSCDLLNAGTVEAQFKKVADWLADHPYEVVSILMGNYNFLSVDKFIPAIQNSGLLKYVYEPPKFPMALGDWPTLGEMILSRKRVVIFMDYKADQTAVNYILDEFTQIWETPFSPTNASFPCNVDRPPNLASNVATNRMYMANHNLNVQVGIAESNILIPDTYNLNLTNAASGTEKGIASLGASGDLCNSMWNRPPNFLLVDYYERGNVAGSVFQVAAKLNGVVYSQKCCGLSAANSVVAPGWKYLISGMVFATVWFGMF